MEAALDRHGLRGAHADPKTPVILQTFGESTPRALASKRIGVPIVLLVDGATAWDSRAMVGAWRGTVSGFGPAKEIVVAHPEFVTLAHAAGMTVTPYTFRSTATPGFASVTAEMEHFLYELGVDGLFTNNPDRFPRR